MYSVILCKWAVVFNLTSATCGANAWTGGSCLVLSSPCPRGLRSLQHINSCSGVTYFHRLYMALWMRTPSHNLIYLPCHPPFWTSNMCGSPERLFLFLSMVTENVSVYSPYVLVTKLVDKTRAEYQNWSYVLWAWVGWLSNSCGLKGYWAWKHVGGVFLYNKI